MITVSQKPFSSNVDSSSCEAANISVAIFCVSVMIFSSFQGSLDFFTPSQSISVVRFIKQMFQIGMENAVRTCPYHEKRERNLQASCSNVDLLLEFSK